jgi:hypothetical protein
MLRIPTTMENPVYCLGMECDLKNRISASLVCVKKSLVFSNAIEYAIAKRACIAMSRLSVNRNVSWNTVASAFSMPPLISQLPPIGIHNSGQEL